MFQRKTLILNYKKNQEVILCEKTAPIFLKSNWYWRGRYLHESKRNYEAFHRIVLSATTRQIVDHINGNSYDNRIENLRFATRAENARNRKKIKNTTSQFKGVSWDKEKNKWQAVIYSHGKRIFIGYFESEFKARDAYNKKARIEHGKFTREE